MIRPLTPEPALGTTRVRWKFALWPRVVDVPGLGPCTVWLEWVVVTETYTETTEYDHMAPYARRRWLESTVTLAFPRLAARPPRLPDP
jgi:hypothetical protein